MGYQAPYPYAVTSKASKNGVVLVKADNKTPQDQVFQPSEAMDIVRAMTTQNEPITRLALWIPGVPAAITKDGKGGRLYEVAYAAKQLKAVDLSTKVAYLTYNQFGGPHVRLGDPQEHASKQRSAAPLTRNKA